MTEEGARQGAFVPLPPKIRPQKSSSYDSDDDRSFIIEDRSPRRTSSKRKPKKGYHKRKDSKLGPYEVIETVSSPKRETEAEKLRRKLAERHTDELEMIARQERAQRNEAEYIASNNANAALSERQRAERLENITQRLQNVCIDERDGRRFATREAEEAYARAQALQRELEREQREKRLLEREKEVLEQERRAAERARPVPFFHDLRPVDIHQEPWPLRRDPGDDVIRRAQHEASERRQHTRDDDLLFSNQRDRLPRGRRASPIVFDDDEMRSRPRRR